MVSKAFLRSNFLLLVPHFFNGSKANCGHYFPSSSATSTLVDNVSAWPSNFFTHSGFCVAIRQEQVILDDKHAYITS